MDNCRALDYSYFQLCAPSPAEIWHFVFSREQLTGCGHCLPLSSNRPPLSGPKVQKRPRVFFCFFPPLPFADLIIPTNRRSKAGKKKKACPALRTSVPPFVPYRTTPLPPPRAAANSFATSLFFHHNTTPIPPSTPRAPGCPRPKPFNTFQLSSSSCFTSSIELSPFPCHHPVTSSITPRCLPRRAPPPRR